MGGAKESEEDGHEETGMEEQLQHCVGMGADGQQLFHYLQSLLTQVEAATGSVDLEMREKIGALYSETRKVPHAVDLEMNSTEISHELDQLSDKLKAFEQKLSEVAVDPEVHGILSETADLWMPLITSTAEDRRKLTSEHDAS